jgi:hypothetical protein
VFALPSLSETTLAARRSPIRPLLRVSAMLARIPSPVFSMLDAAKCGLERVLQLLGGAVSADRLGGPAEQRGALLDDVALDLARLDAAADVDDLLAGRDFLADRLRELERRRPRARLDGERLRRADVQPAAARRGRAAVRLASASGGHEGGAEGEDGRAL